MARRAPDSAPTSNGRSNAAIPDANARPRGRNLFSSIISAIESLLATATFHPAAPTPTFDLGSIPIGHLPELPPNGVPLDQLVGSRPNSFGGSGSDRTCGPPHTRRPRAPPDKPRTVIKQY
ncbi:hypothetical protein B0H13DRAFT_2367899 [Mycena leptocephala]|nr:hypothetical protein B0H13DRAFT_2367899 [Mycena leptocephala]